MARTESLFDLYEPNLNAQLNIMERVRMKVIAAQNGIGDWEQEIDREIVDPGNPVVVELFNILRLRALRDLTGIKYALVLGHAQKFPGIDPYGKYSEIDMGTAQSMDLVDCAMRYCPEQNKHVLQAMFAGLRKNPLCEEVTIYCEQIRLTRYMAMTCPYKAFSLALEKTADGMEKCAMEEMPIAVQHLNRISRVMRQLAGIDEGPLEQEDIAVCRRYINGFPENIHELPVGNQVQYTKPKSLVLRPRDERRILMQEAMAHPKNLRKPPQNIVEAVEAQWRTDLGKSNLHDFEKRCVSVAAQNELSVLFAPCERMMGRPRTIDQFNRGTLVIVGSKTVSEQMQEYFETNKEMIAVWYPQLSGRKLFEKWYDDNLDEMTGLFVSSALFNDEPVEVYIIGPDGKKPEQPIQMRMAGQVIKDYTEDRNQTPVHIRLQINERVMEQNCLELGSDFTTGLFLEPYFRRYNINDEATRHEAQNQLFGGEDRATVVAVWMCVLAANGADIEEIMKPTLLENEKATAMEEYMQNKDNPAWLSERIYFGHKSILNQIDNKMDGVLLKQQTQRGEAFSKTYPAVRALHHTIQKVEKNEDLQRRYIYLAQKERARADMTARVNDLKGRVKMAGEMEPGDANIMKQFLLPYFMSNEDGLHSMADLSKMTCGEGYSADSGDIVSACFCIVAADEETGIMDIVGAEELKSKRVDAVKNYVHNAPTNAQWLGEQFYRGHKNILNQLKQMMEGKKWNNYRARNVMYFSARVLDNTLQVLNKYPGVMEGYIRAAQNEQPPLDNVKIAKEGAERANNLKERISEKAANGKPDDALTEEWFLDAVVTCILAGQGYSLEEILDSTKLPKEREQARILYASRKDDDEWLGARIFIGQEAVLTQMKAGAKQMNYPVVRMMSDTCQYLDEHPDAKAGYIGGARRKVFRQAAGQKRVLSPQKLDEEAVKLADEIKACADAVANSLELDSAFASELFLAPCCRSNEDGIESVELLCAKIAECGGFPADSSFGVAACFCILAADGAEIPDIMNPQQLQDARVATVQKGLLQGDAKWLGEQFYKGHMNVLNQLNQMMNGKDRNHPQTREMIYFTARVLANTLQVLEEKPEVMEGYLCAAQEELIQQEEERMDGTEQANNLKELIGEQAYRMEPGNAATTELFLEPYCRSNEDGIESVEKLSTKIAEHGGCPADSGFMVAACFCILAADGAEIPAIMNPEQLQDARVAAVQKGLLQGDAKWLGEQFYKGHKNLLNQINQVDASLRTKKQEKSQGYDEVHLAVRSLFYTLKALENNPEMMEGYVRAALQETNDEKKAAREGVSMAKECEMCIKNIVETYDTMAKENYFRAALSRPLLPEIDEMAICLEAQLKMPWMLQQYEAEIKQWYRRVGDKGQYMGVRKACTECCPDYQDMQKIGNAVKAAKDFQYAVKELAKGMRYWEKAADVVCSEKFVTGVKAHFVECEPDFGGRKETSKDAVRNVFRCPAKPIYRYNNVEATLDYPDYFWDMLESQSQQPAPIELCAMK